jgi:glucokinase
MIKVLALDVGGTNIRIAKIDIKNRKPVIKKEKLFLTKDVNNLSSVINGFKDKEEVACIGFAGPIVEKEAKLTNADLRINIDSLKKETGLKEIKLINDFHAVGYGLPFLKKKDIFILNHGKGFNNNVEMVVGPGTGLGKAYIINNKVYPCEGGLTTLGVGDIGDYALFDYIRTKYNVASVYYEDVVSGRGLLDIYDHLEIKTNMELNMKIMKLIRAEPVNKAKIITKFSQKDKLCDMTLQIFTKFYSRFVRNSVLNLISSKVYLVGGITNSIQPSLKRDFMQEFLKHRVYQNMLKKVEISIVLNSNVGLLGAGAVAGKIV